jgi:pyruvate-ferredoxin/flavodoxin oxidoreductase
VILAYSHCIAHGYDMADALSQQEKAVDSAYWPLFRYDPRRVAAGESPLKLDSAAPKIDLSAFVAGETRFRQVEQANPEIYKKLMDQAQLDVREKYALYEQLVRSMSPANRVPGSAGAPPKAKG